MRKRPTSLTVIAWILIVSDTVGMVTNTILINDPKTLEIKHKILLSITSQNIKEYLGCLVVIISGVAMLRRYGWSRFLYIGWFIIVLVLEMAISPMKTMMIPSTVVFLVIVFFLFRPKVNDYFSPLESFNDS